MDPLTQALIQKALAHKPAMEGTVKDPGALIDRQYYSIPPNLASKLQLAKGREGINAVDQLMTNPMYRASMGMSGTGVPLNAPPDFNPYRGK